MSTSDLPDIISNRIGRAARTVRHVCGQVVIEGLDRRSKYLLFRFGADTLLVHFGMTGSLRAFVNPPPRRLHDHVDIVLDSGLTLRYHDPRRFGAMLWLPPPAEAHPLLAGLGPEPFDRACDADYLWRATRRRGLYAGTGIGVLFLLVLAAQLLPEERADRPVSAAASVTATATTTTTTPKTTKNAKNAKPKAAPASSTPALAVGSPKTEASQTAPVPQRVATPTRTPQRPRERPRATRRSAYAPSAPRR